MGDLVPAAVASRCAAPSSWARRREASCGASGMNSPPSPSRRPSGDGPSGLRDAAVGSIRGRCRMPATPRGEGMKGDAAASSPACRSSLASDRPADWSWMIHLPRWAAAMGPPLPRLDRDSRPDVRRGRLRGEG